MVSIVQISLLACKASRVLKFPGHGTSKNSIPFAYLNAGSAFDAFGQIDGVFFLEFSDDGID
jgi:hypothetical protein